MNISSVKQHSGVYDIAERRPMLRKLELLFCLLALLLFAALVVRVIDGPLQLKAQRVLFEGVYALNEQDVLAVAGITRDDSILFFDSAAVVERVERMPYVKKCEVKRILPSEVLLRIVERKPIASVMQNNHVYEIDREYVVLRELPPFAPHTGPLITNLPDLTVIEPGAQLDNAALARALDLWEVFENSPIARELTLSELSAEHPSNLRMFFDELPFELRWGRTDFEEQSRRLETLWRAMEGDIPCEQYLDLRFDADLVCK